MSTGGRLISRIPGEGLSVIPVVEGGTPTAAMIAGAQAVTPFSFVPSWTGTKAELLAQIDADPTVLVDDGPRFSAYLSKIIELGHPLAYRGMIYINSYNPVTVAGRNVDLRQFGDGCIVGGPDLDNRLLKIINTSGDFARVADCHIDGMKFNVEKCAPGTLNSINCFEPSGFRTVLIENCDFYHGEFYQTGGGDSGVLLSCANATLRNNRVQGAVDLGFYITGSNDGLQDNRNLIIEGNTFVNCANGWSAKRNYRYVRSVGNHYVGCRNGSSITATPVGGTGLGTIGGSLGIMAAETHENCGASCIDLRDTHGWNVQCTVAGTFGYDKDGLAIASASIVKLDDADNCRVDFVAEVTSTDVTHAAVRIQNGSVNNVVNGTVKGIYNGMLETNGNYNNVTLKLDADVTVPGTIFGANTQFTYDQEGVRSYYVGVYDRLPGRSPFNVTPFSGSLVFNINTAQRTVQIETGASSVKAILPVAVNGDEVTIHKTATSGVGLIQVRDPTNTTTIHNIVDAGAMATFRYAPGGWVRVSRSIRDNALSLVQVAAANVATPPNNCQTLFIDSADGAVKAKDSAGAVQAYALDSDVAALGDAVETLALTASVEYPTIADGLAATTEGGYFVVRESGDNYATRYQKVGGVEVFDNALASKAGVEDAVGAVQAQVEGLSPTVAAIERYSTKPIETLHAADYDFVIVGLDGALHSALPESANAPVRTGYVETLHAASGPEITLDAQGRLIQASIAAPTSDISARVSAVVDAAGIPVSGVLFGWKLHYTRARIRHLADLKAGTYNAVTNIAPSAAQLVLTFFGDSYTQGIPYYIGRLTQKLLALCGDAGVGWIGFAWFSGATGTWTTGSQPAGKDTTARFREAVNKVDVIGTWACTYNDPALNTPSLSCISSSTAGDYVTWDFTAGHNACNLFYTGDGTGVVAVSWDDGVAYGANIPLSTVGASNVALTGVPSGAATARIKVISGNVKIAGVDMQSANSGVRIHKLGASGSRAQHWASVTPATWGAQLAALAPDLVSMPIGANDQGSARSAVQFKADLTTVRANVRAVLPYTDLLFQGQPENARTNNVYPMSAYRAAMAAMVIEAGDAAMLDHQYFWGPPDNNAAFYYNAGRKWLDITQMLHPEGDGQYAMTDAIWRLLTAQI